ncbi:MAG: haloacid dehalogenase type II [Hyphomicrobiales bacterium]|nr:haloacid dehalogenase type II [Hyphomicrobiales bacterium]
MTISAYVFDAYGTLFDIHAAVRRHADAIGPDGQQLSEIWRAKQLEYSWVRSLMGRYRDFWQLTQEALDYAFAKVPSADRSLRDQLLDAYWRLDTYPEVVGVLRTLKERGTRLAILSNGSPEMLAAAVESNGLDALLDDVFSIDPLQIYKTDERVYELVTNHYRIFPETVSFQSSNRWDVAGATAYGFRTVWINRTAQPDEYTDLPAAAVLSSLDGLLTI